MSSDYSALSGDYTIDGSHSRIGFSARHAMVTKVRGAFDEFEGTFHVDGENPANSSGRVVIQAKSINTRNSQRDECWLRHVALVQEPVPHDDRVEQASGGAVGDERRRRDDADFVAGRERLRAVQKDAVEGQMQVTLDHEVERSSRAEVQPQRLDARHMGEPRRRWHGQSSGLNLVRPRHVVVSVAPDPRMHPDEP